MSAGANQLSNEVVVYRVAIVPGGITHPILGAIPDKGCIPLPVTKDGTMTTVNTDTQNPGQVVLGTGTLFVDDSDFQPGRFLCDANGVVRRIKFITSNTMLTLVNKFPASVTGIAVKLVINKPGYILARSVGTAAAILQEESFAVGESIVGEGAPLSYDVSAANTGIDFSIHE